MGHVHNILLIFFHIPWSSLTFLWQAGGGWFCGIHVDNGRIGGKMKKTLREVVEKYNLNVRLTPNQNLLLCDIRSGWKRPITMALAQGGLLVRVLFEQLYICNWHLNDGLLKLPICKGVLQYNIK